MSKIKKIVTFVLIVTFAFSPVFAVPAQAQWIDISTMAKDYGLDALAFQLVNMIIKRISASTVNWINSGFKGKPAYVTNPEAYFTEMGNGIAGTYIFNNPDLNFLCGPIRAKIKLALTANYNAQGSQGNSERWACTLTQVGQNMDNFMDSFDNGGWNSFFEVSQKQQNNPIGAYMMAENDMLMKIAAQQGTAQTELNQGSGFMSFKKCKAGTERVSSQLQTCDANYNTCQYNNRDDENNLQQCATIYKKCIANNPPVAVGDCTDSNKETVTPGSVISDKLNSVLGQSEGRLVMADEINEMISALISQLTEKLLGAATKGLSGLSDKNPADNNQSFTGQMLTSTSTEDYFNNSPNTSAIDQPVPDPASMFPPGTTITIPPASCDPATDPSCTTTP